MKVQDMSTKDKIEKMLKKSELILAAGKEKRISKKSGPVQVTERKSVDEVMTERFSAIYRKNSINQFITKGKHI